MKSQFEPIVVQWIQTKTPIPSPHARKCEGYFSVSTASGGLSIMADNDSLPVFFGMLKESLHVNVVHQHNPDDGGKPWEAPWSADTVLQQRNE